MPVKCAMCPKKNATLDDSNAVKCSKCGLLYHPSCAKRAKINADGWVSFCCYSTAADEVNEVNDLDENSRVLFKLIEAKFNGLKVKFNGLDSKIDNTLITVKEKLCELDDRVLKLEDNNVYLLENVISEINKRNSKECNCIIYKLEDSENAVKKDIELFKNLLACCNDEPSFNINDIKLIRLGKKFKSGVDRPLKVVFPNKDCLHWFFHNKKMIIEKSKKSIIITGDLTNAQRDFCNKVLSEIKLRREKGEDNLFMKYINGIPTIVNLKKKLLQQLSAIKVNLIKLNKRISLLENPKENVSKEDTIKNETSKQYEEFISNIFQLQNEEDLVVVKVKLEKEPGFKVKLWQSRCQNIYFRNTWLNQTSLLLLLFLESVCCRIGGHKTDELTKLMLRRLLSDKLALLYSWLGAKKKK
ncbi:hypothetical protein FQA39_LY09244 [Lamprigera yunnana]|nr:hypothetical protein FQA39_LY09244 [Lamprigera yunnana]